jgi:hypothetical protein
MWFVGDFYVGCQLPKSRIKRSLICNNSSQFGEGIVEFNEGGKVSK